MYKSGRYLYVLLCAQAVEKMLKGLIVHKTGKFPPRTNNLVKLALLTEKKIAPAHKEFLCELAPYFDKTRYPKDFGKIISEVDKKFASVYLGRTKELLKWIKGKLK